MQTPEAQALTDYLAAWLPTYLNELQQLCAVECPTSYKPGVDEAGAWVRAWAARRGWAVRAWPDAAAGDGLVATVPGGTPGGLRVMLVAHLDTVYPLGTVAARPCRRVGDRLIGPATADNKSGLLSALYAVAALHDCDMLGPLGSVSVVCGGDEETDMRASLDMLTAIAPAYDMALVMEAGRENGDIVGARKASATYTLKVHGRSAHAGVEPHKGASAVLALAQQITALHLLNGMRPGVTLNVGVISGGTVFNAVPDHAQASIDVRCISADDMQPVDDALRQISTTTYVAGTRAVLSGGWQAPPMARTPAIDRLAARADACAQELGFRVAAAATGGVSYANALAQLGLPVLDGLGPIGGLDHSPEEYILVSSIVPRTALLALLMLREAQAKKPGNDGTTELRN